MIKSIKVTLKYKSLSILGLLFIILTVQSKDKPSYITSFHNSLTTKTDTLPPSDTIIIPAKDSTIVPGDSTIVPKIDTIDLKISKDSLEGPLDYSAEDSMVFDVPTKIFTLYGKKAKANYKQNEIISPIIVFDQKQGVVSAFLTRDSTGKVISMPTFKQEGFITQSDSLKFNIKTGKGITKSTYTQQGEMFVYGERIKKITNDIFFAQRARFTTCNLDTPHFAFISSKVKFINNKWAFTGPVHPEFEGIPIPIYLPFGIYPLKQGRQSGVLTPQFTVNEQLGLGLEGLGYYKVFGNYWDAIIRGNLYSYGGWSLDLNPRYMKRYKYTGNINLQVQHFNYNFKGDPDFTKNRSYHVTWSHNADTKARPGVSFQANVNAGSSSFNSFVPNNPMQNFSNQLNSSIVYAKNWKDKPYNLSLSANHNQNTNQKLININLPDAAFNVNTLYPFRKKEAIGTPKWYENLGIAYNGNARSLFSFYDTSKNILQHILDTFQWGAHHSIPISISLPQMGAFQLSPQVSYEETWYQTKVFRTWNPVDRKLETTTKKGFYTARQMSFGMSLATRIFGLYGAKRKDAKVLAVRHEIRPSMSMNYKPDLNKHNWHLTQVDTFNNKAQYSLFEGNVFGPYSPGEFGGMSFAIDNNLQMKVRNRKDTGENAIKRVMLIDGLSLNGSYNFLLDSFALSLFQLSARSTLFQKVNITAGAVLDPYDFSTTTGQRSKSLLWKRKPISFGRFMSGNVAISSQFQGGKKGTKSPQLASTRRTDFARQLGYGDEYMNELAYIRSNPGEFADFNIPWSVNFGYSLRFDKILRSDFKGFTTTTSQDLSFGGTLNLTPKWQLGGNGLYNLSTGVLGSFSLSISRELHCWQMSINLAPVGRYKFYSIFISPKSGILRDLKINRTRSYYESL